MEELPVPVPADRLAQAARGAYDARRAAGDSHAVALRAATSDVLALRPALPASFAAEFAAAAIGERRPADDGSATGRRLSLRWLRAALAESGSDGEAA